MRLSNSARRAVSLCAVVASVLLATCGPDSPPTKAVAPRIAPSEATHALIDANLDVLVGAGNIVTCSALGDEQTAAILDTIGGTVFTTGDNVSSTTATAADYTSCYGPSWGRHLARTRPAVGEKDYATPGAAGYYTYFGGKAVVGDSAKYYYSYEKATWHVIVLNSEVSMSAGSPQELWLKADLAAHPNACTAAIWDSPRFYTNGVRSASLPIWKDLYGAGVDLIINGHQNNYERFSPQTPTGTEDPAFGIRQIIVGTGGYSHGSFGSTPAANSEVRDKTAFGVLKVTLEENRYEWQFIPAAPATFSDAGTSSCHGAPPPVAVPGGPYTAEGTVQFDGSKSSDPNNTALTYAWNFGDNSAPGTGAKPTHAYVALGSYTTTLTVTNAKGISSAPATTSVTIVNYPPVVNAGASSWLLGGGAYTLNATFTDPGNDGPFNYVIDWGDSSPSTSGAVSAPGKISAVHSYATSAKFTATLKVTDARGASGSGQVTVLTAQPSASAAIFIGAGDMAQCGTGGAAGSRAEQTARLIDAEVAANPGAVAFTLGDNQYQYASLTEYLACYDPTWGRFNSRMHPLAGNHEYNTPGAAGYWQYFTERASPTVAVGDSGSYYYSYDVGTWHVVVLNDNIETKPGSPQEVWLRADLAAHPARCTIAMWHKPKVYQGGVRNGYTDMWNPLYQAGAELVLNGHVHRYERYAEQTPSSVAAPGRGIREIIVGTGGAGIGSSTATPANLEIANGVTYGVIKLWLDTDGYFWKFIPIAGQTFTDVGYTACH